ncbi:hypothetical protein ACFSQ7_43520 [Paenibacillus rhizoplanae]
MPLTLSKVSKTSRISTSAPRTRAGAAASYEFTEAVPDSIPAEEIRELTLRIYF